MRGGGTTMLRYACLLTTVALLVCLSGCGMRLNAAAPTAAPPKITSTAAVGFAVAVTGVPIPSRSPTLQAPTPTAFVPPSRPYVVLVPDSGPPASKSIDIEGAHLPASTAIQLQWSSGGNAAPISHTAYSDAAGRLRSAFIVPSVNPGAYQILASVGGKQVATATYYVKSAAALTVKAIPTDKGYEVRIRGAHFLHGLRLLLVAYPLVSGEKPLVLGTTRATDRGTLAFSYVTPRLRPGQYVLRAFAASLLSSQMAEAFFQVVL